MKKYLILFYVLSSLLWGQQIKSWQNYTNFNQTNDFVLNSDFIWVGTDGGVFNFSISDNSYQIITKSEGLSSQTITSIAIDLKGKIWIGTAEGYINVYDPVTGTSSTLLQIFKTDKSNKRINDIQIKGDTAFVSTAFGLSLVNTMDLSFFDSILKFGDFPTETEVANVFLDDVIYVVTQAGIAINVEGSQNLIAPESWGNINLGSDINATEINKMVKYKSKLHLATDRGILREENGNWDTFLYSNINISDILVKDDAIYSAHPTTIHKFETEDEEIFSDPGRVFNKIDFYNNELLIGSNKGIVKYSLNDTTSIIPNSPGTNAIIDLTVDSEGNLWSATGKNNKGIGVLKFNGEKWELLEKNNTPEFRINDFHRVSSSENAVYLSTWGTGFVRYKDEKFESFNLNNTSLIGTPPGGTHLAINDVQEDAEGNAWIVNYSSADLKPLSVLTNDGVIINFQFSSPLTPQVVNLEHLVIDQYNTKWISGDPGGDEATEGIYYFNENGTIDDPSDDIWGKLTSGTGLRNRDVKAIAIDQFGELIIGTSVGVDVIPDPSNPNSIRGDQYFSLRQQTINCISVDPINQKWFGTEKGIFLTNSDGSILLANYTKANSPLPSDNIKTIAIDDQSGMVYVGTDFGVTAIATLFVTPNKDFSSLHVYPNPISLENSPNTNIVIEGLIEDSEIRILDIAGNLINEFRSIGGKTTTWNCRDLDDNLISSGIYIVVAYDSEVNEIGHAKLAVIRK